MQFCSKACTLVTLDSLFIRRDRVARAIISDDSPDDAPRVLIISVANRLLVPFHSGRAIPFLSFFLSAASLRNNELGR